MFHYKDCTEEMGFVHCNGLLESSCELKAGIWKEGTLTTTNRYLCDFNDEYQEKILFEICYQMPNAQGVVKCCDVDYTQADKNCVHFKMIGGDNIENTLEILSVDEDEDEEKKEEKKEE